METKNKYSIRKTIVGVGSILIGSCLLFACDVNLAKATDTTNIETVENNNFIIPYVDFEIENNILTKEQELEVTKKIKELNNFSDSEFSVTYDYENIIVHIVGRDDFIFTTDNLKEKDVFTEDKLHDIFYFGEPVYVKDLNNITEKDKDKLYKRIKYSKEYEENILEGLKITQFENGYILSANNVRPFVITGELKDILFEEGKDSISGTFEDYNELYAKENGYLRIYGDKNLPADLRENVDLDLLWFLMRENNLAEWNDYVNNNEYLKQHNIKHIYPVSYNYGYDVNNNILKFDLSNSFEGNPQDLLLNINVFYNDGTYKRFSEKVSNKTYAKKWSFNPNSNYEELFKNNSHLDSKANRLIDALNKTEDKDKYYISTTPIIKQGDMTSLFKDGNYSNSSVEYFTTLINSYGLLFNEDYTILDSEVYPVMAESVKVFADRLSKHLENPQENKMWYNMVYNFEDGSKIYLPVVIDEKTEAKHSSYTNYLFYNLAVVDKDNFVDFTVNKSENNIVITNEDSTRDVGSLWINNDEELLSLYEDYKKFFNINMSYEDFKSLYITKISNAFPTENETVEVLNKFKELYYDTKNNKLGSVLLSTENNNNPLYTNRVDVGENNYVGKMVDNVNVFGENGLKDVYIKDGNIYELDMEKTLDFNLYSILQFNNSHYLRQHLQKEKINFIKEVWRTNPKALQDYKQFKTLIKQKIQSEENILLLSSIYTMSGLEFTYGITENNFTKEELLDFYIDMTFGNIFNVTKSIINGNVVRNTDYVNLRISHSSNEITTIGEDRQQGLGNLTPWMTGVVNPMFFSFEDNYADYMSTIYFYNEVEKEEKHPNTYPTWELPEAEVGIHPNTYPTWEMPSIEIPEIPNTPPNTTDNEGTPPLPPEPDPEPERESTHPNTYPTWELPEAEVGVHPNTYPTHELPEAEVGVHPNTYPTIDKPEGNVGIYPNTYPTHELPEINLDFKVPNTYPTIEKPEANLDFKIPNTYPTWELPSIEFPTKPTPPPVVPENKIEIPPKENEDPTPKEKELPKTNTDNTYMYTISSLLGLAILLKRKQKA